MAGMKEIRNRIKSIQSTHQITKAMEIVSTTKFNKLSVIVKKSKPYSEAVQRVLGNISQGIKAERHPLFDGREKIEKILAIVLTSDSGLCGSFNSMTLKEYEKLRHSIQDKEIITIAIGKKARDYCNKRKYILKKSYISLAVDDITERSREISEDIVDGYYSNDFDEVYIIYSEFISALKSDLRTEKIVPIEKLKKSILNKEKKEDNSEDEKNKVYIFEPNVEQVLKALLPKYLNVGLYQKILNNMASEYSARKNSMKNATENAEEIMKELDVLYNRQRQGAITQEITEIVSGASAQNQ